MDSARGNTKPAKIKEALAQYGCCATVKKKSLLETPGNFKFSSLFGSVKVKVKAKFTLEQAMKAQRGSRGIALLIF